MKRGRSASFTDTERLSDSSAQPISLNVTTVATLERCSQGQSKAEQTTEITVESVCTA
jgi:hypothetical protein